jgi:hypothetical protein
MENGEWRMEKEKEKREKGKGKRKTQNSVDLKTDF